MGRDGKGDVKIRAVWEEFVHIGNPPVNLNLGTDGAEAALAGFWNMADLLWVVGAGERGEPETFRLSAVDDLPDVEGHVPFDLTAIEGKEEIPVFLKNLFECERGFAGRFHTGQ